MKIADLLAEAYEAEQRLWFIQRISNLEQTDDMLKARLDIRAGLFVQVFFSESSGRFQMALVREGRRLYGRDNEGGGWHIHPYGSPEQHTPASEETSPRPLLKFLAEVERLLLANDLV